MASVASKWQLIGTCLEVEQSEIDEIEKRNLSPKEALCKLLSRWLDTTNHTVTWADIVDVLRQPILDEKRVAQQIEDDIGNRSSENLILNFIECDFSVIKPEKKEHGVSMAHYVCSRS